VVTDEKNYRAETTKIAGLAFLSPLGRIILDPLSLLYNYDYLVIFLFLVYSIVLAFIGLVFVLKAHDILEGNKR